MQISHLLIVAGVAAIGFLPISSRAADTDAQIKAREALRSKFSEIETQTPVTNVPPAKPKAVKPTPTIPASQPQTAPTPAPVNPEPQPQTASAPHPNVPATAPPLPPPRPSTPAPAPVRTPPSKSKKSPPPVIAAPAADPDKIALAREQMRQKLSAAVGQEQPEPATPAVPAANQT